MNDRIQAFKGEIKELCKKHNVGIGHEDTHGGFVIRQSYDEKFMKWFMDASTEDKLSYDIFKEWK